MKRIFKHFKRKAKAQNEPDTSIEFSYKEFLKDDGTTFTEHLKKLHFFNLDKCKSSGKILGLDSKPSTAGNSPHGFELENRTYYQSFLYQFQKISKDKFSDLQSTCATLSAKVEDFAKSKAEFIKIESEKIHKAREIAEKKTKACIAQKRENLKERLSEIITTIKNLKNEIREIEAQLAKDYETKSSQHRRTLLIGILGILAILDFPMNFKTVLLWRDDIISTLLITALFSLVIPFAAHSFGSYLKKKSISIKEIFWMIVAIFSALGISWIIGDIRYDYLAEKNIKILSAFGYGFINFVIFLIGSWISFHLSYKNPEKVKALLSHKKELCSSAKLKDQLQNHFNNLDTEEAHENQKIDDLFPEDVEIQTNSKLSALRNELIVKERENSAVINAVQSVESLICSYYEEAIYAFRSSNERWRNAPNPLYWKNPLLPLQTFFAGENPKNSSSGSNA